MTKNENEEESEEKQQRKKTIRRQAMDDKIKKEPQISDYYDGFLIDDFDAPKTEEQKKEEQNLKSCIEKNQEKYRKAKKEKAES